MTPVRIGLLHGGASYHLVTLSDPVVSRCITEPLYLPDLDTAALGDLDALVVADRVHPDLVRSRADELLAVPRRGGTLVVLGELVADDWVPGLTMSPRPTNFWWWRTGEDPGVRAHEPDHALWQYLETRDVIWHHHGLLHPPPDALVLASVCEENRSAGAILYVDEASTPGRLVVTSMDPVHHHGGNFMPAATRFLHGLLGWLAADLGR